MRRGDAVGQVGQVLPRAAAGRCRASSSAGARARRRARGSMVRPDRSTVRAPAGTVTDASGPTAAMRSPSTTIVPPSITSSPFIVTGARRGRRPTSVGFARGSVERDLDRLRLRAGPSSSPSRSSPPPLLLAVLLRARAGRLRPSSGSGVGIAWSSGEAVVGRAEDPGHGRPPSAQPTHSPPSSVSWPSGSAAPSSADVHRLAAHLRQGGDVGVVQLVEGDPAPVGRDRRPPRRGRSAGAPGGRCRRASPRRAPSWPARAGLPPARRPRRRRARRPRENVGRGMRRLRAAVARCPTT